MPWLKLLRPHQWSKNLLVFLSLLAGHQYGEWPVLADTALAFVAFCMLASCGYILNDWLDRADDRNHPDKRHRPLAAGEVSAPLALAAAAGLLLAGLALAQRVNMWVFATAAAYLLSTLAYSLWLKRKLFIDVVMLGGLYTLRIIGGVAVVQAQPSVWLLAFAMFMFTGLAILKRYVELNERSGESLRKHSVRAYTPQERPILVAAGLGNGLLSVLVLALYLDSGQVRALYAHVLPLWLLCPLLLYWTGRIWLLASRSEVHTDPILFALGDRLSSVRAAAVVALAWLAT